MEGGTKGHPFGQRTSRALDSTFHRLQGVQSRDSLVVDEIIVLLGRIVPEQQQETRRQY